MSISELFEPLSGGRMSREIVSQILPLIRNGRLKPGDRLPAERELSQTFGVSRVTVRDALRVLEVMGLVEIRVGSAGGAFVTVPSTDVVGEGVVNMLALREVNPDQLAETRAMLELAVLDLVLARITDEEIEDLRELCRRSRELAEAGTYDPHLSNEFHARLARCTHNDAVALLGESFAGPLSMADLRAKERPGRTFLDSVNEHTDLVEAIAAGDASRARRILRDHLLRNVNLPPKRRRPKGKDSGRITDM
jgi:GntR family transcriptional regulator, transcriptional repressor for pyruvate dehydrogenase complex